MPIEGNEVNVNPTTSDSILKKDVEAVGSSIESLEATSLHLDNVDAYLENLVTEAVTHRAVRHPYLHALAEDSLPDLAWALQDFAKQYYGYSAHFPRFLTVTISKLENPGHRATLMENLLEESGQLAPDELAELINQGIDPAWVQGIPHPELFRRFMEATGAAQGFTADTVAIDVVCWREVFYSILANGSTAEAIGALGLGTENIVKYIYRDILSAIKRYGQLERAQYVFFELHCEVDDHHHASLLNIARDFAQTAEGRWDLRKGMHKALNARVAFWDWMYERALHPRHEMA